jgi:hypothetical protein
LEILKAVSKKRDEWMLAELKRVKALDDEGMAKEAVSKLGRGKIWHELKRHIKAESCTREV